MQDRVSTARMAFRNTLWQDPGRAGRAMRPRKARSTFVALPPEPAMRRLANG
jgi:hypothetical protein